MTLFHPATGDLRAQPVLRTTNAILHPWLKQELTAILTQLPAPETLDRFAPGRDWSE